MTWLLYFFGLALVESIYGVTPPAVKWVLVTEKAAWHERDSSGELVFHGRLWMLGGWFDSYSAPPRDVWNSSDGRSWNLVTDNAPWKYSDLAMSAVFQDHMWVMGGWTNGRLPQHGATNEVWSSTDGKTWKLVAPAAAWSPRLAAGVAVFKNRLWILGGTENYYFGDQSSLKNDVWSSDDGQFWRLETPSAPWLPRAYLQAVAYAGKLWVMGGGNYVPEYEANNDVWCSDDGVHWEQVTAHAPWSPRLWFSAVTYRDHIWVLGGWSNNPFRNWNDVWYSRNGRDWTRLESTVIWRARHEHSTFVFNDTLWVAGGEADGLSGEVWSLNLPKDFFP